MSSTLFSISSVSFFVMLGCAPQQPPHSPEYYACVDECARQKDTCMLEASNATSVTTCDSNSRTCGGRCR